MTYNQQLLEAARSHRQYRHPDTDRMVSASIIERYDRDTPLNERETKAFTFIATNPEFLDSIIEYTREVINAGHLHWSIYNVIQRARWDWEVHVRSIDDHFLLNDHVSPYLARILNEMFERPLYLLRSVEGEPGHKRKEPEYV